MRQACRNGIRPVLSKNRRGVRHLLGVPPPQANRKLLRLFLQVVANVQLGVVADAVVDSRKPLPRVLVECDFLRSEEHTSELQSHSDLVCRLLLEKKKNIKIKN